MPRAKGGTKTRARHKKRLKLAKGYYGAKSRLFRTATEAVDRAQQYAYRDRRNRKRDFRRLWIARITAACRSDGCSVRTGARWGFADGCIGAGGGLRRGAGSGERPVFDGLPHPPVP